MLAFKNAGPVLAFKNAGGRNLEKHADNDQNGCKHVVGTLPTSLALVSPTAWPSRAVGHAQVLSCAHLSTLLEHTIGLQLCKIRATPRGVMYRIKKGVADLHKLLRFFRNSLGEVHQTPSPGLIPNNDVESCSGVSVRVFASRSKELQEVLQPVLAAQHTGTEEAVLGQLTCNRHAPVPEVKSSVFDCRSNYRPQDYRLENRILFGTLQRLVGAHAVGCCEKPLDLAVTSS